MGNIFTKPVLDTDYLRISRDNKVDKKSKQYTVWLSMIKRCYSLNSLKLRPTYKDVIVCEEWHNFQNFAEWFEKNYIEGFHLDKDILKKNNKIYSPETCCFVPSEINNLVLQSNKIRGEYPIGVSKRSKKFISQIKRDSDKIYLGIFNTPQEAFQVYKIAKEKYIKEVANKYKTILAPKVFEVLINYQVNIND